MLCISVFLILTKTVSILHNLVVADKCEDHEQATCEVVADDTVFYCETSAFWRDISKETCPSTCGVCGRCDQNPPFNYLFTGILQKDIYSYIMLCVDTGCTTATVLCLNLKRIQGVLEDQIKWINNVRTKIGYQLAFIDIMSRSSETHQRDIYIKSIKMISSPGKKIHFHSLVPHTFLVLFVWNLSLGSYLKYKMITEKC